jgi:cytochrome c-type biogenesis protein CcmH
VSTFVLGVLLLTVVAGALLLWPRSMTPRPADQGDPNLAWFRQRSQELSGDEAALLDEAELRLLEEGGGATAPPAVAGRGRALRWVLLPLLLLVGAGVYSQLGAFEDVLIYRALESFDPQDREAAAALTARIAARSAQRPENLQYLDLLGQLQLSAQDFSAAARTHEALAQRAPQDPSAQAQAAQSRFLAAGRVLDEQAQLYAERALALNPEQSTALGLLGMAAFEQGQYNAAIVYWERLQAQETEGSPGYQLLADVIGAARSRLGGAPVAEQAPAAPGVTVSLALADTADAPSNATVFVFARSPAAASRMPIAVRRLSAADLPTTLRLTDADSMAGQQLSGAGEIVVSAQLSRNGQPGDSNAAFIGRSVPVTAGGPDVTVSIELTAAATGG